MAPRNLAQLVLALLVLTSSQAQGVKTLADRSDDQIRALVGKAEQSLGPEHETFGATVLYQQDVIYANSGDNVRVRNVMIRVFDPSEEHVGTQRQDIHNRSVDKSQGWILREDGDLLRLGDEDIRTVEADGKTTLVVAFPQVRAGDTLGVSVVTSADRAFFGGGVMVASRYPIRLGKVQIVTDGTMGYRLMAENAKRSAPPVIKEEKNGTPSNVVFTFKDLPAYEEEPFALPDLDWYPHVLVVYRGRFNERFGRWLYNQSWAEQALFGEFVLDALIDGGKVKKAAQKIAGNASSARERADRLCRFVRDDILLVETDLADPSTADADEILRRRSGTSSEKSFLMASLMEALNLPFQVVFVRDRLFGPVEEDNPGLMQYPSFLVVMEGEPRRWYDPACTTCPPGEIEPQRQNAPAMVLAAGLAERNEQFSKEIWAKTGNMTAKFVDLYSRRIKDKKWCSFFRTPGDPEAAIGETIEVVRRDGENGSATLEVESRGFTAMRTMAGDHRSAKKCARAYVEERFPDATLKNSRFTNELADGDMDLALRTDVVVRPLPPATEGEWVLPAETIFGLPLIPAWKGPHRSPFHVPDTQVWRRRFHVPLPDGWEAIEAAPAMHVEHSRFEYVATISAVEGELIVDRTVTWKPGTSSGDQLFTLDGALTRVHDFESTPLVVVRWDESGR